MVPSVEVNVKHNYRSGGESSQKVSMQRWKGEGDRRVKNVNGNLSNWGVICRETVKLCEIWNFVNFYSLNVRVTKDFIFCDKLMIIKMVFDA